MYRLGILQIRHQVDSSLFLSVGIKNSNKKVLLETLQMAIFGLCIVIPPRR